MTKPWGILIPEKYIEKIFPKSKRDYANYFILHSILRRVSILITFYVLKNSIIKPNLISYFQFFITFTISISFINQEFILGSALLFLWVLLDNIDGELARLKNLQTNLGIALERYNSDFMYSLCVPSLCFGLFRANKIDFDILYLSFFSCVIFSILRHFIARFPEEKIKPKSFLIKLLASQFKNMVKLRKKNKLGSFIFYIYRNVFNQVGLIEIIIFYGSVMYSLNKNDILINIATFYTFSYFIFDVIILFGVFFFIVKK